MRRGAIVGAAIGIVGLIPATASAICGGEPPLKVWPHYGGLAPTNAQIVVQGKLADAKLVTAPRASRARAVVALTPAPGGVFKLPALEPSTSYELRDGADRVVGVFTTGTLADSAPPTWPGVTKVLPPPKPAKGVQVECSKAVVRLEGPMAATDDLTARSDVRYALWAGKALDYTQPPTTWTTVPDDWRQQTFALTYDADALPKERPLKLGIKAIDLAGNASAASELTLP